MYANFNTLYNECGITPAHTDSTRFSCGSLAIQKNVRKSIDYSGMAPIGGIPCSHNCKNTDVNCLYKCALPSLSVLKPVKENFTTLPPRSSPIVLNKTEEDSGSLLPVMDPSFNLREICKQCILLEDHLSHDEKRCFDCCVKHFLTIEALAEEAITLDSTNKYIPQINDLPTKIRTLQSKWHQDPKNNSRDVSQGLRLIRKDFQIDSFGVVFNNNKSYCEGNVCKLSR